MTTELNSYLTFTYFGQSDVGLQRSENQDAFGKFPGDTNRLSYKKGQLFIVADGMGGHQRGREASELAVRTICDYLETSTDPIPLNLKRAFEAANTAIHTKSEESLETGIMGTTCVALLLTEHNPYIAHVGDSRVYRVNEAGIEQLTEDHSKVAEMLREGILTEQEAAEHPSKSVLSRALGVKPSVEVDIRTDDPLESGNHYVLCSDGLSAVEPKIIQEIVLSNPPREACQRLIDLANEAGGHDNVTVQVIKVYSRAIADDAENGQRQLFGNKKLQRASLGLLLVALVGFAIYALLSRSNNNEVPPLGGQEEMRGQLEKNTQSALATQITRAQKFVQSGKLDSALDLYQSILKQDPMQMEALQGIRQISNLYRDQGDLYLKRGAMQNAVESYEKAADLQPANEEFKQLITLAKEKMHKKPAEPQMSSTQVATSGNAEVIVKEKSQPEEPSTKPPKKTSSAAVKDSPLGASWQFPHLNADAVTMDKTKLVFSDSPEEKKGIYSKDLDDVDVGVTVRILSSQKGRVGIIIGYQTNKQEESYYLFTSKDYKNFVLSRCSNNGEEHLITLTDTGMNPENTDGDLQHIKVKVLGPWIMMYHNGKLLNGWLGDKIVKGKIGVYAAANLSVEFSQFQLSSALDYDIPDQNQKSGERE